MWTFLKGEDLAVADIFSELYRLIARSRASINYIKLLPLPLLLHAFEEQEGRKGTAEALHHTCGTVEQIKLLVLCEVRVFLLREMIHIWYNSINFPQLFQFLLCYQEILSIRPNPNLHHLLVYFGRLLNMRYQILTLQDGLLELTSPLDRASVDILGNDHTHKVRVVDSQPLLLCNGSLRLLQSWQIIECK